MGDNKSEFARIEKMLVDGKITFAEAIKLRDTLTPNLTGKSDKSFLGAVLTALGLPFAFIGVFFFFGLTVYIQTTLPYRENLITAMTLAGPLALALVIINWFIGIYFWQRCRRFPSRYGGLIMVKIFTIINPILTITFLWYVYSTPVEINAGENQQSIPQVVSVNPDDQNNVDPKKIKQIKVVFSEDMNTGSYSFTGGGKLFPQVAGNPKWIDQRTCVLPVKLEVDRYYRYGINSPSHKNFKSTSGVPTRMRWCEFMTLGNDGKRNKMHTVNIFGSSNYRVPS